MKIKLPLTAFLASSILATSAFGQLFVENFETDVSNDWQVNVGAQASADFHFDYSTVGIPQSPNSSGSDTHALRLDVNWDVGTQSGLSVSPIGQSFTGDFILKFDHWSNYSGPLDDTNINRTMLSGGGIGTDGTKAHWSFGNYDSFAFTATGDGGSAADYRIYAGANHNPSLLESGPNNTESHYSDHFPSVAAPADQLTDFPSQSGSTQAGVVGMRWTEWEIQKTGDTVTWSIDGLLIGTVENYSSIASGDNIFFNRFTAVDGAPGNPEMNFTLIDNISVIPEPSTYAAIFGGLALLGAFIYRRRSSR